MINKCIHCGEEIEKGSICERCTAEDNEDRERSYIG